MIVLSTVEKPDWYCMFCPCKTRAHKGEVKAGKIFSGLVFLLLERDDKRFPLSSIRPACHRRQRIQLISSAIFNRFSNIPASSAIPASGPKESLP